MLPVNKNVSLPKALRPTSTDRRKYPFEEMDVNDMFFIPGKDNKNLPTYASTAGKRLNRKFTTRACWMKGSDERGWTLVEPGTKGAVQGVGVWRTK